LVAAAAARAGRVGAGRPWLVAGVSVVVAALVWTVVLSTAWFTWDVTTQLPTRADLAAIGDMALSTTIYDRARQPVFTIFKEQRIEVPLDRVSPHVVRAVVSVEDQRFYEHRGIDLVRVGAAVLANLRSGRRAQGGSTITQQLARQSFLSRDKTFRRKVKEMLLAAQIEHSHTKPQILELYLNKVYFGDGLHGIEAASLGYFGRHAAELDVAQAALLAGLIQSPSAYAPSENPEKAIGRRNVVLQAMRETGAIDAATFERARQAPLILENGLKRDESFGLYVKEMVRRQLVDRFGWERVSEGGLRVHTTIDSALQARADALVEESLQQIEARPGYLHVPRAETMVARQDQAPDYLQAAVVVLDPHTGEVRALVGGRDFKESRFNRAVQARRQAGSAFKPFVYAAALEAGHTPVTLLTDLDDPVLTAQGGWVPEDEHSSAGAMTMRTALRTSSNRAAVRMITTVGIQNAVKEAELLGVGPVPAVPSLALGSGEVTLLTMTAAFAAFADAGQVREPILVTRVEDGAGQVLYEPRTTPRRATSEATAFLMSSMLADVINAGTAYRARAMGFTLPAAGKTGTTNDYRDAWFIGYTPRLVTGVWVGFDQPKTIARGAYASDIAVPLWATVMRAATAGDRPEWFERPRDVVGLDVCRVSGKLPADGCWHVQVVDAQGVVAEKPMVATEYFVRGTQPSATCDLHVPMGPFQTVAEGPPGPAPGAPIAARDANQPGMETAPASGAPGPGQPASAAAATTSTGPGEPAKKKKGFWSRIFGRDGKEKPAKPDPP
jgi:penicillin-binding protein 1A